MTREDLGALFARVTRHLIAAERPILASHGLTMWEYIALSQLGREAAQSQLALAHAIGHDKTRLIPLLDAMEERGLLVRVPDPADRRARIVQLTAAGRQLLRQARADIRTMESTYLRTIPQPLRASFLTSLAALADTSAS